MSNNTTTTVAIKAPLKFPLPITTSITDFSKFRESGELSDILVFVQGKEFKLHKFPLFIRSDFFRALARGQVNEKDKVELADFPGGADVFEQVANFCYNIRLKVDKENVCQLRCAAEFLQMTAPGNLGDLADKFFNDILSAAKLGRNLGGIIQLLEQCQDLGEIAEQAGIVEKCILSIVDCWLISSKYTRRSASLDSIDLVHLKRLTQFPLNWFLQLFVTARDKCVRPAVLATMIEMYVSNALHIETDDMPNGVNGHKDSGNEKKRSGDKKKAAKKDSKKDKSKDGDSSSCSSDSDSDDEKEPGETQDSSPPPVSDEELAKVLDTLLLELPENAPLADTISPHWAARMLQTAQRTDCQSRQLLLQLAARLLHKFSPEDLSDMSPDMLAEILKEASKTSGDQTTIAKGNKAQQMCQVIDNYMLEQARKDELSVETFSRMVQAVPSDNRENHDLIFEVLEALLKSDAHKPSDDERKELLEVVDCSRLSEATLLRAYESELVPKEYITKAAIALCARLRTQLQEARSTIYRQEEELKKYGLGRHATTTTALRTRTVAELTGASGEHALPYFRSHVTWTAGGADGESVTPQGRSFWAAHDDYDGELDVPEDRHYDEGLGSHKYSPRGSTAYSRASTLTSPRTESERPHHSIDTAAGERDYLCYSSSYDAIYRPRYLESRDTIVYDTSYVDTYSDLYRPYSYYNSGS